MNKKRRRYELKEPIGKGGMGEVFRGECQGAHGFRSRVAIKQLRRSDAVNGKARARLQNEAEMGAGLDHPNVVPVLDFDESSTGDVRLVMMYMDGVDLDALIQSGPLPIAVIEYIAGSVLSGLAYVHKRGIIHRDISLGNILISRSGGVRISDFGLAVRSVDGAPVAAPSGGTMGFTSPEALREEAVDARTDLFSAGAVIYELLTGKAAFPGRDGPGRMALTLMRPPPAPHDVRADVPRALSDMIMRLLASNRVDRYASALDALDMLPPSKYGSEELAALLEERHQQGTLTLHRALHEPSDRASSEDVDSWSALARQPTKRRGTVSCPDDLLVDPATFYHAVVEADAAQKDRGESGREARPPSRPPRRIRPRAWRGVSVAAAAAALIIVGVIIGQRATPTTHPGHDARIDAPRHAAHGLSDTTPAHRADPAPSEVAAPVSSPQPLRNVDRKRNTRPSPRADRTARASTRTDRNARAHAGQRRSRAARAGASTATDTAGSGDKPGTRTQPDKALAADDETTGDRAAANPFERFAGPMGDTLPGEVVITP